MIFKDNFLGDLMCVMEILIYLVWRYQHVKQEDKILAESKNAAFNYRVSQETWQLVNSLESFPSAMFPKLREMKLNLTLKKLNLQKYLNKE